MNILQDVQDEYSKISGISLWICSSIFENLTEKSLTADFLGEDNKMLINEIDSYARTLDTIQNTASFEYEGIKFLIRRDPFYMVTSWKDTRLLFQKVIDKILQ